MNGLGRTVLVGGPVLVLALVVWRGSRDFERVPRAQGQPPVEAILKRAHAQGRFSGSCLVWHRNVVVARQAFGWANRRAQTKNTVTTPFLIASVTKHFTATLAYVKVAEGQLRWTHTLAELRPVETQSRTASIELGMLVRHTSGLQSYTTWPDWPELSQRPVAPLAFVEAILSRNPDFEPGQSFSYSNSGYYVLGQLLEATTGAPLSEQMDAELFRPAGLRATRLLTDESRRAPFAALGYERLADDRVVSAPDFVASRSLGAGALESNVEDLARWAMSIQSHRLFGALRAELLRPGPGNYAAGLLVAHIRLDELRDFLARPFEFTPSGKGTRVAWHWGSNPGFNSLWLWWGDRSGLVLLENVADLGAPRGTHLFDLAAEIAEAVFSSTD